MIRSAWPGAKGDGAGFVSRSVRAPWWTRAARLLLGDGPPRYAGVLFVAFVVVTAVFYSAIRRHDVDLSFEERLSLGQHLQSFGNQTVYVAEATGVDLVLARLPAEDWRKISGKVDYVAYTYDSLYIGDVFPLLRKALEDVSPRGYGIAVFSCGCLMHNVILQHASVRFEGLECAMLPGFVFEKEAVRWVETPADAGECLKRDRSLGEGWYKSQSWKLQSAREEYELVKAMLEQDERAKHGSARSVQMGREPKNVWSV